MIGTKPKSARELADKVLVYGAFSEALEFLEYHLQTTCLESTTVIIRGSVGCGKKTLMKKAEELYLKKPTTTIYLDPYFLTDDIAALKYINTKLGLPPKQTLQEVCQSIRGYKRKAVIVLQNFEVFCRKNQNLLYCLTDFNRNGSKINLIGLTISLDCTELVEKRVRSRLNAIFYYLPPPYRNVEEYLEFTSILLGNHKIEKLMRKQLEFQYQFGNKSIRELKHYLTDLCSWTGKSLLIYQPSNTENASFRSGNQYLEMQLKCLTKNQLELLTIAVCYCDSQEFQSHKLEMSLLDLQSFTRKRNYDNFDSTSTLTCKDTKVLATLGLFKPIKSDLTFSQTTLFTLGAMPAELRKQLVGHEEFESGYMIWRLLR